MLKLTTPSLIFVLLGFSGVSVQGAPTALPTVAQISIAETELTEIQSLVKDSLLIDAFGSENSKEHDVLEARLKNNEPLLCFVGRVKPTTSREQVLCSYRGFVVSYGAVGSALYMLKNPTSQGGFVGPNFVSCSSNGECLFKQSSIVPHAIAVSIVGTGLAVDENDYRRVMDLTREKLEAISLYRVLGHGMEGGLEFCLEFSPSDYAREYVPTLKAYQDITVNRRQSEYAVREVVDCGPQNAEHGAVVKPLDYLRYPALEKKSATTAATRLAAKLAKLEEIAQRNATKTYLEREIAKALSLYLAKAHKKIPDDLKYPTPWGVVSTWSQTHGDLQWMSSSDRFELKDGSLCELEPSIEIYANKAGGPVTQAMPAKMTCTGATQVTVRADEVNLGYAFCPSGHQGRGSDSQEPYCWE